MGRLTRLDLVHAPLEGVNLAEASAGTGKTYAIAALFVRLIVEYGLDVDGILVVTFTEAATEELKDRVRNKLRFALQAFGGEDCTDTFLVEFVEKIEDRTVAVERLQEALRAFDKASIYTIHGFCQRVLHDNAFESGRLFDTELVAHLDELKVQVVYDFWRRHFYRESSLFVNYILHKRFGPQDLLPLLNDGISDPHLRVIPPVEDTDSSSEEYAFLRAFEKMKDTWSAHREEIKALLLGSEALNRNKYRIQKVLDLVGEMDRYAECGAEDPMLFADFEKFTQSQIEEATKKGCAAPVHPLFRYCDDLKEAHDLLMTALHRKLTGLKTKLVREGGRALAEKKRRRNIQSFHDLLLGVYQALNKKGGKALTEAVRRKYRVILVDEFQDTDPLQYAIFRRVFGSSRNPKSQLLFFIGDPKQAIYAFRNADVFAYMAAAKQVHAAYTLEENWRSEPDLIRAVNAIFKRVDRPFLYEQIPFHPVAPAPKANRDELTVNGRKEPPFHLWFLDARKRGEGDKPLTKERAREEILRAVAAEISRLLILGKQGMARIGEDPIREADMAVLVRTNAEARQVKEVLSVLGIPSVVYSGDDLFASPDAEEMERILSAVAEPNNVSLLAAALATDSFGQRAEDLHTTLVDDRKWEEWVLQFTTYHELWRSRGFMAMFRRLMVDQQIMARLAILENGERRNTNLRHLCEVLNQAAFERRLGMTGLLKWLQERRRPTGRPPEEYQLRLESDENAVNLVTVHKSKGLEYPIVFCPFAWEGVRGFAKEEPVVFHDTSGDMKKVLDLGSEKIEAHRIRSQREALAEDLRLLYVALTRAMNRCYMVWGRISGCDRSAPAYLFHGESGLEKEEDIVTAVQTRFKRLSDEDVFEALKSVTRKAAGTIRLVEMPDVKAQSCSPSFPTEVSLCPRRFDGNIDRSWATVSFSSIAVDRQRGSDFLEHDSPTDGSDGEGVADVLSEEKERRDIFVFPAGATAGNFIHSVFEDIDFSAGKTDISHLVTCKLAAFGYETEWTPVICRMIEDVLSMPLAGEKGYFTLSDIDMDDRLSEMEFYFSLKSLSPGDLESAVGREIGGGEGRGTRYPDRAIPSPSKGYMRGFIDLVFRHQERYYIVDWKSNYLGPRVADYSPAKLRQVMRDEDYALQYLIYTVALHRYLALRLPEYDYERHFGGVFYLFVRGMQSRSGDRYGVYRARPERNLIQELSDKLMGQGDQHCR